MAMRDEVFFMFRRTDRGACLLGSSRSISFMREMGQSAARLGYDFFVYQGKPTDVARWKAGSCYKMSGALPTAELAGRRRH